MLFRSADYTCPTPSLAAQFIVDHNTMYYNGIIKIKEQCKKELLLDIKKEIDGLTQYIMIKDKIRNCKDELLHCIEMEMKQYDMMIFDSMNHIITDPSEIKKNTHYTMLWKGTKIDIMTSK